MQVKTAASARTAASKEFSVDAAGIFLERYKVHNYLFSLTDEHSPKICVKKAQSN